MSTRTRLLLLIAVICLQAILSAGVGDVKLGTNHSWNRGELYYADWTSLWAEQQRQYVQMTGSTPTWTDEHKALAAYGWRGTHYFHDTPVPMDHLNVGFATIKADLLAGTVNEVNSYYPRAYWTGLFGYGFALCGTTHAQWTCELDRVLGNSRSHVAGVNGHNTFEAYLTGGNYGAGQWVLLDQDELCVIFDDSTTPRLYSLVELDAMGPSGRTNAVNNTIDPTRRRGWYMFGQGDFGPQGDYTSYDAYYFPNMPSYNTTALAAGYEGAPPMLQLRRGESLRRYLKPGLGGSTYVFWGRRASHAFGVGPGHDRTYASQPELMYELPPVYAEHDSGTHDACYGNAVYTYKPDFATTDYREGVVDEGADYVIFEFNTPYVIGATPPSTGQWDVCDTGGTNGLKVTADISVSATVQISLDMGGTWSTAQAVGTSRELTDLVKGSQSYWIRFNAGPAALAAKELTMTTICQLNPYLVPQVSDVTEIKYKATQRAMKFFGPEKSKIQHTLYSGTFGSNNMVLELTAPRNARIVYVYAGGLATVTVPSPDVPTWNITAGSDGSTFPVSLLSNYKVDRSYDYANDTWNKIGMNGEGDVLSLNSDTVYVKFSNDQGKPYPVVNAWIVYELPDQDESTVTFNYGSNQEISHTFTSVTSEQTWTIGSLGSVATNWVEVSCDAAADPDKPTANFTFSPATPLVSEVVTFTDTSTTPSGTLTAWSWDFGDSGTSTLQNPTHTYAAANTYTVILTVTNSLAKNDSVSKNIIVVSGVEVTDTFQQGVSSYSGCEDAYIRYDDYSGHGAEEEIRVYEGTGVTESRLLIKFDMASIAAGSTVTDAKLEIYAFNMYGDGTMNMHAVTADWNEDAAAGADWYQAATGTNWASPGGDYSGTVISSLVTFDGDGNNAWYEWTIPAATVQGWIDTPGANYGVILVGTGGAPTGNLQDRFRSSEYAADANLRPKLTVTYYDAGGGPTNNPPNAPTNPLPANSATGVSLSPTLSVTVSDPDSDAMTVTFYNDADDSVIGTDTGVASGTTASVSWSGLSGATVYSWYAVADDGTDTASSAVWSFTTVADADTDGMADDWEITHFGNITTSDGTIDSDGDGASDLLEYMAGKDPTDDTDFNATTDTDSDGMADITEFGWFGDLDESGSGDFDGDGHSNTAEITAGTDPTNPLDFPNTVSSGSDKGGCLPGGTVSFGMILLLGFGMLGRRRFLS